MDTRDGRGLTPNPDVVCSALGEGGVLFDLDSKQYFALNSTGLLLWEALEDGRAVLSLAEQIAQTYADRSCAASVRDFADRLVSLGLAVPSAEGAQCDGRIRVLPADWVPPEVTAHGRPLAKVILSPFDPTVPVPE
jgi:hypothetical protein